MREQTLGVGIIGCGNISQAYLSLAPLFRGVRVVACADIDRKASAQRAGEFGVRSEIDVYIGRKGVEITTPVQEEIEALLPMPIRRR